MCNLVGVDRTALGIARTELERSGKNDIAEKMIDAAVPAEAFLRRMAIEAPALYMLFVTEQMMRDYT